MHFLTLGTEYIVEMDIIYEIATVGIGVEIYNKQRRKIFGTLINSRDTPSSRTTVDSLYLDIVYVDIPVFSIFDHGPGDFPYILHVFYSCYVDIGYIDISVISI